MNESMPPFASSDNALRNIIGRDDDFREGHVVVGDEDDLEEVADVLVRVDDRANAVNEADDPLGHIIARGGLTACTKGSGTQKKSFIIVDRCCSINSVSAHQR
jgi:hypothetical protein